MTFDPTPSPARHGRAAWITGMARSLILTVLLVRGVAWLAHWANGGAKNVYVSLGIFVLYPLMNGLLGAFFWRQLRPSVGQLALASLYLTLAFLAITVVIPHKHLVGLILLSPLFYVGMFGGACLGRALFKTADSSADVAKGV